MRYPIGLLLAVDDAILEAADSWCAARPDCTSRSDAMNKLVEIGLAVSNPPSDQTASAT
jgi:hypothetical protein